MSASEAIRTAAANGVRIEIQGQHLILDAEFEPPVDVVEAIRRDKAEIIEFVRRKGDAWAAEDWHAFCEERAGIAEFDGGQSRKDAEAFALECCVIEWLNGHPETSDPGSCAWCGKSDGDGHAIVPFGTESYGHAWSHPECWSDWHVSRRQAAGEALARLGIKQASYRTGGSIDARR